MNKERILKLADFIEKLNYNGPDSERYEDDYAAEVPTFNMAFYINDCGTAGCIAGWAVELFGDKKQPCYDPADKAAKLLDIDWRRDDVIVNSNAHKLFYPAYSADNIYTPQEAAQVLREFVETGEVNWPKKTIYTDVD